MASQWVAVVTHPSDLGRPMVVGLFSDAKQAAAEVQLDMSTPLPPALLFHWSPTSNRGAIGREGLRGRKSSIDGSWRPPHVCFASTPSLALALCHADDEPLDLWCTYRDDCIDLERVGQEWRAYHAPAWYVATRVPGPSGFVGPLVEGDKRCPACGLDPVDPSLHRPECPIRDTTQDEWASIFGDAPHYEAACPLLIWDDSELPGRLRSTSMAALHVGPEATR